MNGQEYLNQISAEARPAAKPKMSFLGSPIFKVAVGGVALFIVIMIFGSILSGGKAGLEEQTISLKLHIDNTISVISEYQNSVKSSELRSSSASLSSVLSNTNRDLTDYVVAKYGYKDNKVNKNWLEQATLEKDALVSDLFNAKINGILDRIYAHKMAYEISMIVAEEGSIYNASSDEALRTIMGASYESLNNLYKNFSDFSETK